jgi:hypothetical protein
MVRVFAQVHYELSGLPARVLALPLCTYACIGNGGPDSVWNASVPVVVNTTGFPNPIPSARMGRVATSMLPPPLHPPATCLHDRGEKMRPISAERGSPRSAANG